MEKLLMLITVCAGIIALGFAVLTAHNIGKKEPGNSRMKEIAENIADGAKAFLYSEYKILVIFVIILFALIWLLIGLETALCFVVGALFSTLAGYFGMNVATKANVRTANAAKETTDQECVIQFVPNAVGEVPMTLVFDDNVDPSHDKQSTLIFVEKTEEKTEEEE